MLKVPEHQVAGHIAKDGKLGPLIDDQGRFYKPLQGDARGENEAKFYESFSSNKNVPDHIHGYFPVYHGVQLVEASDGSGKLPHMVLEDVVSGYVKPSVMDVKIGSRTWYPDVSEEYFNKCIKKDRATTTVSLGFRVSGLKIFDHQESKFWRPDKRVVLAYKADGARMALRKFVSSNSLADSTNCAFVSEVYGGSNGILAQLLELKAWFETQTLYHFNSCSILMVYENESVDDAARAQVKLVDFAHVLDGNGVIDHNFLGGLCSFIKFIQDILESSENCHENGY
ncbi:hypothetical protein N665_2496s0008 [Sinapis alba]|nr:hypothetical protein N665_2496s0008 [Sinapis alba]